MEAQQANNNNNNLNQPIVIDTLDFGSLQPSTVFYSPIRSSFEEEVRNVLNSILRQENQSDVLLGMKPSVSVTSSLMTSLELYKLKRTHNASTSACVSVVFHTLLNHLRQNEQLAFRSGNIWTKEGNMISNDF